MTNQPEESHPMRDRVDKAISWFTETDEPDAVDETGAPTEEAAAPTAETGAPVTASDERGSVAETPAAENRAVETPVVENRAAETPAVEDLRAEVPAPVAETEATREGVAETPRAEELRRTEETAPVADESTRTESGHLAAPAVAGGALAAGAVAEHERRSEREADREAEQASTVEPTADRVEPAAVDDDTHVRRHEPPASWAEVHPNARHVPPEGAIDSEAETTGSQRSLYRDEAPTVAMPAAAAGAAAAGAAAGAAAASGGGETTAVLDASEFARMRREERAARDRQLGKVIAAPEDADAPVPTRYTTPSTYRPLPSLGFLVFRLLVAAVVGIRAWQHVTHLSATRATWAATLVPSPGIVAYAQIGLEIAIAVMLVIGLGTRIAGLLLLVLSVVSLVFVQWGAVNPFQPGANDFIGVVDVLLAGAGLLFATAGGGRAAFDGAIHSGRIRRKNDKLFA